MPAMRKEKGKLFCQRCNSSIPRRMYLPIGAYCRECLADEESGVIKPYTISAGRFFKKQDVLNMVSYQESIRGVDSSSRKREPTLVPRYDRCWKDRDDYQVVAKVIDDGGAVCLASPRN